MRSFGFALVAVLCAAVSGGAKAAVKLAPASGHPSVAATVSGGGFSDLEAVDVYVDTADAVLLAASATGTISGSVTIPVAAQPGRHTVTAVGRHSGTAFQAAFTVTTPWAQPGYGAANLGWNPYENTLNAGNVGSLGIKWQSPVNGLGGTATVSGGRVFAATNSGLEALSTATGKVLWNVLAGHAFYASPALSGSTLYVGEGRSQNMYALNAATGAMVWSRSGSYPFYGSPVVAGGMVYAGDYGGTVTAFSAATGAVIWTYSMSANSISGTPAVAGGVVFVGAGFEVIALNATTGALIWTYTAGSSVTGSPAVANGVVYAGSADSKVYALAAAGPSPGALLWSTTADSAVYVGAAVAAGTVFVGSSNGTMYALNAQTGAVQWSTAVGNALESAVVANGVVYVTSASGGLFAFDAATGNVLAGGQAGASLFGNPTVSDGVVYLNTYGGDVYAFGLLAGTDLVRAPRVADLRPDRGLVVRP